MSTNEIAAQIESLKALEDLIEEAMAEAETLRDTIKQEMLNRDCEELTAGQYIVRWTSVLTQRFDTTAFKKVMLPKHRRKQLLRLIDSTNAHRETVSLESFVAGFQLAAGIARETTRSPYSFAEAEEERASK